MSGPRILILDLETVPNIAHVWGLWQQNVDAMNQLRVPGRVICYGAKWHGERKKFFASEYHDGRQDMLGTVAELLDEADFVVGWNSARFDRTWIQGELFKEGFTPPSPFKDIDLMRVAKKEFRFPSYKLDYVAQRVLGLKGKVTHQGHRLWVDIMEGDDETKAKAWRQMKRYQLGDIDVTDNVLEAFKPWIRLLPNPALYSDDYVPESCSTPGCDGKLIKRGFFYTTVSAFQRYRCTGCGRWERGGKRVRGIDLRNVT